MRSIVLSGCILAGLLALSGCSRGDVAAKAPPQGGGDFGRQPADLLLSIYLLPALYLWFARPDDKLPEPPGRRRRRKTDTEQMEESWVG